MDGAVVPMTAVEQQQQQQLLVTAMGGEGLAGVWPVPSSLRCVNSLFAYSFWLVLL